MRIGSRRLRFQRHGRYKFVIFLVVVAAIVVFAVWLAMGGWGKLFPGGAEASPSALPTGSAGAFVDGQSSMSPYASSDPYASSGATVDPYASPGATVDPYASSGASSDPNATGLPEVSASSSDSQTSGGGGDGAVVLGNSHIGGLELYDALPNADIYYKVGLTVRTAMTDPAEGGTVPAIEELKDKDYDQVFLMFGINEVGWVEQSFLDDYTKLIEQVREYQPNAKIYVMGIMPVSKEVSDKAENGITQEKIDEFNADLKTLANDNDCYFIDLGMAFKDSEGYLPDGAATDGIHLSRDYITQWAQILSNEIER